MLTPSSAARRHGALLVAGGAAAVIALFALRGGPTATASEAGSGPRSTERSVEDGREVERPTTARQRRGRERPTAPTSDAPGAPAQEEAPPPTPPDVTDPAVGAVLRARGDRTPAGTRALVASLTSRNDVVVAEATRALIERDATDAISALARIDLRQAAGSGLSIIDALGRLAGCASDADRGVAVDRLIAMLEEERRRGARESAGNLLQIYEALGQTGDPKAAAPLEAELADAAVPRAHKVVIVAALVHLARPSSRPALEAALTLEAAAQGSDPFEEEIRVELVGALEGALKIL